MFTKRGAQAPAQWAMDPGVDDICVFACKLVSLCVSVRVALTIQLLIEREGVMEHYLKGMPGKPLVDETSHIETNVCVSHCYGGVHPGWVVASSPMEFTSRVEAS